MIALRSDSKILFLFIYLGFFFSSRSSKGGARKMSILAYPEEDSNDLSDLGISNNKDKSRDDFSNDNEVQVCIIR